MDNYVSNEQFLCRGSHLLCRFMQSRQFIPIVTSKFKESNIARILYHVIVKNNPHPFCQSWLTLHRCQEPTVLPESCHLVAVTVLIKCGWFSHTSSLCPSLYTKIHFECWRICFLNFDSTSNISRDIAALLSCGFCLNGWKVPAHERLVWIAVISHIKWQN